MFEGREIALRAQALNESRSCMIVCECGQEPIDFEKVVDTRYVDEALKDLGRR